MPQVVRADGKQGPADAADDNDDAADDAVLDFCLRGPAPGLRMELPAGVAADLRGAPTAAANLAVLPGLANLPITPGPSPSD